MILPVDLPDKDCWYYLSHPPFEPMPVMGAGGLWHVQTLAFGLDVKRILDCHWTALPQVIGSDAHTI
jgi:hypothetical protein